MLLMSQLSLLNNNNISKGINQWFILELYAVLLRGPEVRYGLCRQYPAPMARVSSTSLFNAYPVTIIFVSSIKKQYTVIKTIFNFINFL